ncbi:MAG TPA: dienelactone hydrolase family protein [Candidatus Acidoferrales bacterium]|nr:dienelactone hydrolase family protein [Candidatus Acidoferrales bacterium]
MPLITRKLTDNEDGLPGYIAYPDRRERGPAILIVHSSGTIGYLRTEAYKFAKEGYCTVMPELYSLLGFAELSGTLAGKEEVQEVKSDDEFVRAIGVGWRYLTARPDVDPARVAVIGYCMGGRVGIHFVAATPTVKAFVGYYPSIREEPPSRLRPRHPCEAARDIQCPSMILYGGRDHISTLPLQQKIMASFLANGRPLEWHAFPYGTHGFASPESGGGYQPELADLVWPLVIAFLKRELG